MSPGSNRCRICGVEGDHISKALGICRACLSDPGAEVIWRECHEKARRRHRLRSAVPTHGVPCGQCVNQCKIPEGERGYCGVRCSRAGKVGLCVKESAVVSAYLDPLPTNCVADWVCAGSSEAGYPEYSFSRGAEIGHDNLAVFYGACTFDCLFCQNWHYRNMAVCLSPRMSSQQIASMAGEATSCVCFFGGDPTPFIDHSLDTARRLRGGRRIMRVCWETNGSMSSSPAERIGRMALESGGCIKVDLKAWDDRIHRALTGSSNRQTLRNIRRLAEMGKERDDPPLLVVSTLMVPGYVEEQDVSAIAAYLTDLDPWIPYSLLAFHPDYLMSDMPVTPKAQADGCVRAAREAGLERVHIGNAWLLGR